MSRYEFDLLEQMASEPAQLESTIDYVQKHLEKFISRKDRVMICFPADRENSIGRIMERAVARIGASSLIWGPDYLWKSLLRQTFMNKTSVIIGPPLVILGLSKIARFSMTPLFIRHVITAGYPCMDWMIHAIEKQMDCQSWGCFGPGTGPLITGFSCEKSSGVHIRDDVYRIEIVDEQGNVLPEGEIGEVVVSSRSVPEIRFHSMERGRILTKACSCGCSFPRLVDLSAGKYVDPSLRGLGAELQSWASVLDCRLEKTINGLEIELIVFPGEKRPKLPSCARLIVRNWDPERDKPFSPSQQWKNDGVYEDYY